MGGSKIKEMGSSSKGGIYEVSFGYHSKMEVYANSSSDIPKLYAIMEEERLVVDKEKCIIR